MSTEVTHELKVWPEYFDALATGAKKFEIRKDDRAFRVGDKLWLREYHPNIKWYSGREIYARVTYILDDESEFGKLALQMNYVVMSIDVIDEFPF